MTRTLNPAERYAALKLLAAGVDAALSQAADEAEQYRRTVRARSLETDWGTVGVARRKPTIAFDEAGLLAWCEEHNPDAIIRTVSDLARRSLRARCVIDGEEVIDTSTGEPLDFATVTPGAEYLRVTLSPAAKEAAAMADADQLAAIAQMSALTATEEHA